MTIEDMELDSVLLAKEFVRIAEAMEDTKVKMVLVQFACEEKLHAEYLESLLTKYIY